MVAALGRRSSSSSVKQSGGEEVVGREGEIEGRHQQQEEQQQLQRSSSCVAAAAAEQQRPSWWLDVEASALAVATTSVAVMAPALTEGGPQKPENLLPALPAGGFLTAEQAKQVCLSASVHPSKASNANDKPTVRKNREVLAQFVVSANVQPSKIDEQCLQGIPKNLIDDVINFKFGSSLDGLSDLIAVGTSRKESAAVAREVANGADAIMSDISMGDDDPVDMCYFRTDMGPSGIEQDETCGITNSAEDVINAPQVDDDDLVAVNDTSVTDEDRQIAEDIMGFTAGINVQADDLLRGIMSLNNVSSEEMLSGDSRLIDGCGGLMENVIPSQSTSDEVPEIFSDSEAFNLANLNLLNDVDVMGLMGNDNMSENGVVVDQHHNQQQQLLLQAHQLQQQETTKLAELTKHRVEIERRQHELERRVAYLFRRLRKFQSQLVGRHAAEEAGQVLELAQKSAKKFLHQDLASLGQRAGGNARNFPEIVGNISSFLQKVQKSCNAQSNSVAVRNRNLCRYFGAGSRDNYVNLNVNRMPAFGVPQIRIDGVKLEQVAGPLATKLKIVQDAYDSDCTASSSGGESCDEMQTFNNPHQQQLPILKRASWRWAQDRASVAARWTWLHAQISDLEFRIRQHTELQRQMRSTKGPVVLEIPAVTASTSAMLGSAPSSLSSSSSFVVEPTLNGYSGVLPGTTTGRTCGFEAELEPAAASLSSSRCRPYVRHVFRKRKLVQLKGLHLFSKKAARPASIKCNCDGRLACCALCTGRKDPTFGQDVELMSVQERLALVDPGFHSVLSMPDEVTVTSHADAILRTPEWQQKMARGGVRGSKIKDKEGNERRNRRSSEHRSKCTSRLKKSQVTSISSSKRSRNNERSNHSSVNRKRPTKQTHQQQLQQSQPQPQSQHQHQTQSQPLQQHSQLLALPLDEEEEEEEVVSALSSSSKYSSPVPSPLFLQQQQQSAAATPTSSVPPSSEKTTKEKSSNSHSHSRLRQNSYDIDNIVIPYSVAAATRLEKLPYKEIIIPKWRICSVPPPVDVKNGVMQKSLPDSDVEDVSEDAVVQRHERSEKEEAKRFMNFTHLPYQSRMRRDRRPECRSESGANTPDPMSPHTSECGGDTISPITSPPPTPGNAPDSEHSDSQYRSSSLQNAWRRKMSTRSQKEEPSSFFVEEEQEQQVLPYEPRTFPLTEEDYHEMRKEMPHEHPIESLPETVCQLNENKEDEAEIYSQGSDSTESALCDLEGEDPNDPEWTMMEVREMEKERIRSTVKR
ncbi:KAT8 regulatory NSL complex subunit 1 [Copidosoma floridanum]|uniref:KAT8 regulatory NSL complex subunit 1 n=1 Tax=Copidosoma floridanum TaxID=29053 RepID=UPI0006C98990|nr:KAT8 regulatory NSL complex subunit 1 [Copidosoma floridanum]